MNHYLPIFHEIDQNDSGRISVGELQQYVAKNHIDAGLVQEWCKKLDARNTGVIKIEEILKLLGMTEAQYQQYREVNDRHQKDVLYMWGDMPVNQQLDITKQVRSYLGQLQNNEFYLLPPKLKKYLDDNYERAWNVVVTKAAYSSAFSHDPLTSFHFVMGGYSFSVWKSEEEKPIIRRH